MSGEDLFQTLSHIGKSNSECLEGAEWILKVEGVGIAINTAKLHNLEYRHVQANKTTKT